MKYYHIGLITFYLLLFIACGNSNGTNPAEPDPVNPPPSAEIKPVELDLPEVVFTEPAVIAAGHSSTLIFDRLFELIDATPDNGSIYISIYLFDYTPFITTLNRAASRGVNVHVMADMSLRSDNEETLNALRSSIDDIEIIEVTNDAGSIAINHNKFVLFPEVVTTDEIVENVVFQTSQNFINAGAQKIQDALIFSHEGLYQAYMTYWNEMKTRASSGMANFEFFEYNDPEEQITAYFYPKRKNGEFTGRDTIVEILDKISDTSSASVKIGMSEWTDTRLQITDKLFELLDAGATVEVISKSSIGPGVYRELRELEQRGASVLIYNMGSTGQRINIHTKMMLISGEWNGTAADVLVTGTQNFTRNALQNNNEIILLLENHEVFPFYEEYFEELKTLSGICCPE